MIRLWCGCSLGDLIAATFLAWHHREPDCPCYMAAEKAVSIIGTVLLAHDHSHSIVLLYDY